MKKTNKATTIEVTLQEVVPMILTEVAVEVQVMGRELDLMTSADLHLI